MGINDTPMYRPMGYTYPSQSQQTVNQFMPTFQPSFQSSLAPIQQLQFNGMSNWGAQQVTPGTGPVAMNSLQTPAVAQVPTVTQAPMTAGAFQGANAGVSPTMAGEIAASQATYLNTPQAQWNGQMMQEYMKNNQPSQVGNYANMVLQGVGMAANIGTGIASLVQSQDAFNKQMGMANKNYAAQIKAYNNSLEDKIRGRRSTRYNAKHADEINAEIERKKQKD